MGLLVLVCLFVFQISAEEDAKSRLKGKITELNEQNEVLEFRLLELEDCTEKVGIIMSLDIYQNISN